VHHYRCRRTACGLEKYNHQLPEASPNLGVTGRKSNVWVQRWRDREGNVTVGGKTPPCRGEQP